MNHYPENRIHDSLEKDAPNRRAVEPKPAANLTLISLPRLGGLHHRYVRREMAENLSATSAIAVQLWSEAPTMLIGPQVSPK